ncbi:MAG: TolC family protein, partial [Nitrospirota bacterium]
RPAEPAPTAYTFEMDALLKIATDNSPEIKSREKMLASADAKVRMAKKEYFPDFTITGSIMKKKEPFEDMWSLTTSINIPIFFRSKQKAAVREADALMLEAGNELTATKLMVSSAVRDNYSMVKTAERLIELYKNGLIPKTYQDFESALSGYSTGKVESSAVINRLKSVLDFEILYWEQFIQRENAIARLEAITTVNSEQLSVISQGR